jgi:hypothetical protein
MAVSYVKIFNQVVDEFFRELIEIFPEEKKIKVQYNLFQTLCSTNAKKVCNDFMIGCIPYLEQISMRDEDFFKGPHRPTFLNDIGFENIWKPDLSENTKNAIWTYIKSFFTIGINIIQMPTETVPIIHYIINCN